MVRVPDVERPNLAAIKDLVVRVSPMRGIPSVASSSDGKRHRGRELTTLTYLRPQVFETSHLGASNPPLRAPAKSGEILEAPS